MSFAIKITGFEELLRDARVLKQIFTTLIERVYEIAKQAFEKMKSQAPRKTGNMVRNMSIKKGSQTQIFIIEMKAKYTGFVVFGHRSARSGRWIPGNNFVTPNYQWMLREIRKFIDTAPRK